jgi:signal transduction histidine kinase
VRIEWPGAGSIDEPSTRPRAAGSESGFRMRADRHVSRTRSIHLPDHEDLMDEPILTLALWLLIAGIVGVAILLLRQRHITNLLRKRNAELERAVSTRDEEAHYLATTRLPALADSLHHRPSGVPGLLHGDLTGNSFNRSIQAVMEQFTEITDKAALRADQSAKATLKAMMRSVQSLANEQQVAISAMQDRHENPDVLEDLLKIDHTNSQLARRAQATAVLCGSWPGQQRSATTLTDVVRGATGRIRDYLRIQLNVQLDTAVVSRVVEPVVLTIAELLDNGARHSQPNTSVEITFQPAHNGMAIVIDDAGVGMNVDELHEAARLLAGEEAVDINLIGDPPQVGFAVIGVLAARYKFRVSVDMRSPYGGVRAVVFLPTSLLTQVSTDPEPALASAPAATSTADAPTERTTTSGLPKRTRRQPAAARATAEQPASEPQAAESSTESPAWSGTLPTRVPKQTGSGLGAWQRGTRFGRTTSTSDGEGSPEA